MPRFVFVRCASYFSMVLYRIGSCSHNIYSSILCVKFCYAEMCVILDFLMRILTVGLTTRCQVLIVHSLCFLQCFTFLFHKNLLDSNSCV